MNFVRNTFSLVSRRVQGLWYDARCLLLCLGALHVLGCADKIRPATVAQLAAFEEAGQPSATVDMDAIEKARFPAGPYQVVPGDVLEFTMPALLQAVSAAEMRVAQTESRGDPPYVCRVSKDGTLVLPVVGEVAVAGASLAEIEERVIAAYRPYVALRPSVFVRILEYETFQVSIIGAVAMPGVYALRRNQMSLVALLMEAGGIVEEGAAVIRIGRVGASSQQSSGEQAADSLQSVVRTDETLRPVPATSAPAKSGVRAVFQREGPLCATGWLTIEQGNRVLARKWLDLDNDFQRQAFLNTAGITSEQIAREDFASRLSRLAAYLESDSHDVPAVGWQATADAQFVARFSRAAADVTLVNADVSLTKQETAASLVLPIMGFNIPFHDVALEEGDTVVVEHITEPLFSVLGLVNRPGNFPYPPNAEYNVTQAIAFAGGLDPVARPHYVTIYRLAKDDSIIRIPFRLIEHGEFTDVLKTPIRPGDVVAIESTARTRANLMIHNMLRINAGLYLTGRDLWDND